MNAKHNPTGSSPTDFGAASVLIVDDVPENLKRLAELLGRRGYKVRPAQSGEMALKSAIAAPPDIILLDVRMPGMDGFEVCKRLKSDPMLRDIPVIFVSALDETADKVNGFTVGGVDYVTKPFQQDEVLARVNTHLELRRLQVSLERRSIELSHLVEQLREEVQERTRAEEALRREHETLQQLLRSSDHERRLIAYEIHDGLAQQLAAATMYFETYESVRGRDSTEAKEAYAAGIAVLHRSLVETRQLITNVRPPILDEAGVKAAIGHLICEYRGPDAPAIELCDDIRFERLDPILENAIYRVTQEAITNACKYSRTERVAVELSQPSDNTVRVTIQDWGVGFKPELVAKGSFGIEGIRERARLLGGQAEIVSAPGQGTKVTAEFPLLLPQQLG